MIIDREKAKKVFNDYVKNYDIADEKISLKISHTFRVSQLCEEIAKSLDMNENDINIAWITGLLHDIGRFDQIKIYGTFNDAKSVNHAKLSSEILFDKGMIREFISDDSEDNLIKLVIESHNEYKISENLTEREKIFCNILRDADKVDIFKVNILSPLEEIYNVKREDIYNSEVTPEVLESFKEKDTVLRSLRKTAVDNVVGHISLLFGLVYEESIRIVKEQGYLSEMLKFKSNNENTNKVFHEIRHEVNEYMNFGKNISS